MARTRRVAEDVVRFHEKHLRAPGIPRAVARRALAAAVRTLGRRLVVADWDSDDVAEIFALRAMLEGRAKDRPGVQVHQRDLQRLQGH
jgi:DNA-binding GntR family transcriptional regulator